LEKASGGLYFQEEIHNRWKFPIFHNMSTAIASTWSETPIEGLMQRPAIMKSSVRIHDAISQLQETESHCILVVDEKDELLGVFREEDVLTKIVGKNLSGQESVGEFVDHEDCFTLKTSSSVTEVMDMMGQRGLRYIPLINDEGYPEGIFSIREMIYYISEHTQNHQGRFKSKEGEENAFGLSSSAIIEVLNLPISFALSRYGFNQVVRIGSDESVGRAIKLFEGGQQLAGLLFEKGHLSGLFRIRDLPFKVLKSEELRNKPVMDFMTELPETIEDHETIGNAIARMARNKVLFLHYKVSEHHYGLITGSGIMTYLYDHIHDDF
jgi:CBS domain-containing protein